MRHVTIEINTSNESFVGIGEYFSIQKSRNAAIKLVLFVKSYRLTDESLIFVTVTNLADKSLHSVCGLTQNDSKMCIIFEEAGCYVISTHWHSFILHIQHMPILKGISIQLEQLCIQTVVPKWLGSIDKWEPRLMDISSNNFNAVYFLPLQKYGTSKSPYSIMNHLVISDDIIPINNSCSSIQNAFFHRLSSPDFVESSFCNHKTTASKNATYEFNVDGYGMLQESLKTLKLKTGMLFITDVVWNHTSKDSSWLKDHPDCGYNLRNSPYLKIAYEFECCLMKLTEEISPFRVTLENLDYLGHLIKSYALEGPMKKYLSDAKFSRFTSILQDAIRNIVSAVYYQRVNPDGERLGPITTESPIVHHYFSVLDAEDDSLIFANNGWVMNNEITGSFAESTSDAYFKREIVIWEDCIKLRYGKSRSENAWLWDYMSRYTVELARCFDGFRIDNCHSCSMESTKFFLQQARLTNPDLFIIGELFTGSVKKDIEIVSNLGIDLLVRESLHSHSISDIHSNSFKYSYPKPLGAFKHVKVKAPRCFLMDFTHDNKTPQELGKFNETIVNSAIVAFHNCAVGSNFGYDFLIEHKFNICHNNQYAELKREVIGKLRKFLNNLHVKMSIHKYTGFYCEKISGSVIKIIRENPKTHNLYILYANSTLSNYSNEPYEMENILGYNAEPLLFSYLDDKKLHFKEKIKVDLLFPGQIYIVNAKKQFHMPKEIHLDLNNMAINYLLYRHSNEDRQAFDMESYFVPEYGKLYYCGIQSVYDVLEEAFNHNDMEHPICKNIRNGDWLIDYVCERLLMYSQEYFTEFIKELSFIKKLPICYKPMYLHAVIKKVYKSTIKFTMKLMNLNGKSHFVQSLSLTSYQLIGNVVNSDLDCPFVDCSVGSLAAGLPYFCTGIWRCWARDTFISFYGLFLITKRFAEAKRHILIFASCVKNGLIPNLLDSCKYPRFNSRDSTWWFLQAVQDYCEFTKDYDILNETILLRFCPYSSTYSEYNDVTKSYRYSKRLIEIIHEIVQAHWNGIEFVEDFPFKDHNMLEEGRKIEIFTNHWNGFIYGGNEFNCGTWMDKVRKDKIPATPRHGANIEIVALTYSTMTWLNTLRYKEIIHPKYANISKGVNAASWAYLIKSHFESSFYNESEQFYYDTLESHRELRPNFVIAMAICPMLFYPRHAKKALATVKQKLLSNVALKSVDPKYLHFTENYTCDSDNYHNGPEWIWLYGKYIIAKFIFAPDSMPKNPFHELERILYESPAKALPEIINADGSRCEWSCDSQAWSNACILEAYHFVNFTN